MEERITEKLSDGTYFVRSGGLYGGSVGAYTTQARVPEMIVKLGRFEDLLQDNNIDFNALKQIIEWLSELNGNDAKQMQFICQQRAKIFESNKKLEQENQALKDRWNKLKDIISQKQNIKNKSDSGLITLFGCIGVESFCKMLLDKMQELEQGEDNAKD